MWQQLEIFLCGNVGYIKDSARYAASFDKFNTFFVKDVKNNKNVSVNNSNGNISIIFEDGTIYTYNSSDKGIYREKIQIASNVTALTVVKSEILVENVKKQILDVNIIIGKKDNDLFSKKISYTLRYW